MLFGFEGRRQVRVPSLSTSRFNLQNAAIPGSRRALLRRRAGRATSSSTGIRCRSECPRRASADRPGAADGRRGARQGGRRRQAGVSPRAAVNAERHGRPRGAHPQCAERAGRSERRGRAGGSARSICCRVIALPDGREWAARKAQVLEHRRRTLRRRRRRSGHPRGRRRLSEAACRMALAHRHGGHGAERCAAVSGTQPRHELRVGAESSGRGRLSRVQADAVRRAVASAGGGASRREPGRALLRPVGARNDHACLDDGRTRFTPSPDGQASLPDRQTGSEGARAAGVRADGQRAAAAAPGTWRPEAGRRSGGAALTLLGAALAAGLIARAAGTDSAARRTSSTPLVRPMLTGTCAQCHNAQLVIGRHERRGADVGRSRSFEQREAWEKMLRRLRAGDMPPAGVAAAGSGAARRR